MIETNGNRRVLGHMNMVHVGKLATLTHLFHSSLIYRVIFAVVCDRSSRYNDAGRFLINFNETHIVYGSLILPPYLKNLLYSENITFRSEFRSLTLSNHHGSP